MVIDTAVLQKWALDNAPGFALGSVAGAALTNPVFCARLLYRGLIKIPGAKAFIAGHLPEIDAGLDEFRKDIDATTAADKPTDPPKA